MYFEDFSIGQAFSTKTKVLSEENVQSFLELTGLLNPIFMDDQAARAAGHPGRLVPGPLLLSLAMGLVQESGLFDHVSAVIQFDRLRFIRSAYPGDCLGVKVKVLETRPTQNPVRGLVVLEYQGVNQRGEVVLATEATYLMRKKGGAD